jgi:hypothetical protein
MRTLDDHRMGSTRKLFLLALFGAVAALTLLWFLGPRRETPVVAGGFPPQTSRAEARDLLSETGVTDQRSSRAIPSVAERDSTSDNAKSGPDVKDSIGPFTTADPSGSMTCVSKTWTRHRCRQSHQVRHHGLWAFPRSILFFIAGTSSRPVT